MFHPQDIQIVRKVVLTIRALLPAAYQHCSGCGQPKEEVDHYAGNDFCIACMDGYAEAIAKVFNQKTQASVLDPEYTRLSIEDENTKG